MSARDTLERWGLVVGSLVTTIAVAEVLLAAFLPYHDPFARLRVRETGAHIPRRHRPSFVLRSRMEPGLPGMSGASTFSTNALGFRGGVQAREKPAAERRVFLLGGSTTECVAVDDADAPNAVLEGLLARRGRDDVRVYNAGHSGDVAADHLAMLAHRIAHLEPDVVTVLAGLNDLRASIEGRDPLEVELVVPLRYDRKTLLKLALTELQLPRRVWALLHPEVPSDIEQALFLDEVPTTNYRGAAEACRARPMTKDAPKLDVATFTRDLRSLVALARAHGAAPVLVTQATTWASTDAELLAWHWMHCVRGQRWDPRALHAALEAYVEATRHVAAELDVPVVELARDLPATREHFYDDAHFNTNGARRFAELLAPVIEAQLDARADTAKSD